MPSIFFTPIFAWADVQNSIKPFLLFLQKILIPVTHPQWLNRLKSRIISPLKSLTIGKFDTLITFYSLFYCGFRNLATCFSVFWWSFESVKSFLIFLETKSSSGLLIDFLVILSKIAPAINSQNSFFSLSYFNL